MMNDEMPFERRLSRQPLRPVPADWRSEILAAARAAQAPLHAARSPQQQSWPSAIRHPLSALLWPHPRAWAGLAAVWLLIIAVNVSQRDPAPKLAKTAAPESPEVIVELKKQQRLFAELVGPRETRDADRPRNFKPKPRGECEQILMT